MEERIVTIAPELEIAGTITITRDSHGFSIGVTRSTGAVFFRIPQGRICRRNSRVLGRPRARLSNGHGRSHRIWTGHGRATQI